MPPRINLSHTRCRHSSAPHVFQSSKVRLYASVASSAANIDPLTPDIIPEIGIRRHHPLQPPSHRRPEGRNTQLLRQYVSLMRSCPILLVFQHNSILATELTAIRTVLKSAMSKVDEEQGTNYADTIKLQIMRTGLLDTALRLTQFWQPHLPDAAGSAANADAASPVAPQMSHSLSKQAFQSLTEKHQVHGLEPLLSGPIAMITLPWMSPEHLKVVLSLLSPSPQFPAPKRRASPAYYEPAVQNGVSKLLLLGARIEGRTMDLAKTRWVGGVAGGIEGLRAQLVAVLQGVSGALVHTLNSPAQNLSTMLDGRRGMLDESKDV